MSRQLWLLRHGDAEPHGSIVGAERRLTERGQGQARDAGATLAALGVQFRAVLTSPKLRAVETARLASEALGADAIEEASLAAGFAARDALDLVAVADDDERILVVGHEPDFSQVVFDLTGARIEMKKGGLAGIRLDGNGLGDLIVLLRPRETSLIGLSLVRGPAA